MKRSLESLAAMAKTGDRASLEQLTLQVREPLRAFLATRVPHDVDADDLAQETLMRAFRNLDRYDETRPFTTWLFTIGKRLAINHVLDQALRVSRSVAPTPNFKPATITDPRTALPAFAALACALAVVFLILKLPAQEATNNSPAQPMLAHVETAKSQPMPHVWTEPPPHVETSSRWDLSQLRRLASQAPMKQELTALRQDGKRGIDAIMAIGRRK